MRIPGITTSQSPGFHTNPEGLPAPVLKSVPSRNHKPAEKNNENPAATSPASGHQNDIEPYLDVAISSALDGIALLETAEHALASMQILLEGMRELTSQAADETTSAAERVALEQAIQQRVAEMERVSSTTTVKGKRILQGGLGCTYFQVGTGAGKIICINLDASVQPSAIGSIATATTATLAPLSGATAVKGSYTTPPITDLDFFTAPKHANLIVDGVSVSLTSDWSGKPHGAATAIQSRLNAGDTSDIYTVTYTTGRFTITSNTGPAPFITAASVRGVEFLGGTLVSTATRTRLSFFHNDFQIQIGTAPAISIIGSFHSPDELAAFINTQVTGARAFINGSGKLEIASEEAIAITGERASTPNGLGLATQAHMPAGNLTMLSLLDSDACHHARHRIDSAFREITTLRQRFAETRAQFHEAVSLRNAAPAAHPLPHPHITNSSTAINMASAASKQILRQGKLALMVQANVPTSSVRTLLQREQGASELAFCLMRCPMGEKGCG